MMSRYSTCGRVPFRWICPLFAIVAFALLSVLPFGAAAQSVGNPCTKRVSSHSRSIRITGELNSSR